MYECPDCGQLLEEVWVNGDCIDYSCPDIDCNYLQSRDDDSIGD